MGGSVVALVRCDSYADADVAVETAIELLGGWPVLPGGRVLLKPNVVSGAPPEKAVCTHPAIVEAAAKQLVDIGAKPVIIESPGGPFSASWVNHSLKACGIADAAARAGATLNDDFTDTEVDFPQGAALKQIPLCSAALSAPIVNLCKLKTHGMMTYTGAVKNLFGLVPGTRKIEMHARFPETRRFAAHLNDVALCVGAALHIMDGVIGMEGEGPSHGSAKAVNVILASADPWALDHVAASIIGLDAGDVPVLADARERGLYDPDSIETLGEVPSSFACVFRLPILAGTRFSQGMTGIAVRAAYSPRLSVDKKKCTRCGLCVRSCPVNAIAMRGKPSFDRSACIRCYCCNELCPKGAVRIKKTLMARLIG